MSQLNPNAAEFVPISSPTRNVASPACHALINDQVIAQSPRKATPTDIDINLPNPQDFENEVKSRPSDVFSNGQDSENSQRLSTQEVMENLLNGKNLEEIEFHPASTPVKSSNVEEFHFGPNATPFSTPAKFMDQSEAALSTKAEFGDESSASYLEGKTLAFETALSTENANPFASSEDVQDFQPHLNKPTDPMSMSFYQDENDANPFDLNKVQMLPDDDEFTEKPEKDSLANETISDLPEHDPLAYNHPVTDLDKPGESIDEQKVTEDANFLIGVTKLPQTPEPMCIFEQDSEKRNDIIGDIPPAKSPILIEASKAPLPITPEPNSEEQDISSAPKTPDATSPLPQENILLDVDASSMIPPKSPLIQNENNFGLCDVKSFLESDLSEKCTKMFGGPAAEPIEGMMQFSKSPIPSFDDNFGFVDSKSAVVVNPETAISPEITEDLLCQSKSPIPVDSSTSPVPTPEPITEKCEDIEEFFPIVQKGDSLVSNIVSENSKFEESKKDVEEFFPICSKSPIHEGHPIILENKDHYQEETLLTESYDIKEASKSPVPLVNTEPELLSVDTKSLEPSLSEYIEVRPQSQNEFETITDVPKNELVDLTSPPILPQETPIAVDIANLDESLNINRDIVDEAVCKISQSIPSQFQETPKDQLHKMSEQLLVDEIQNILDTSEPVAVATECEAKSPETVEESLDSEKRDLESPMDDITSSVKDDNSLTPEIIEEAKDISTEKGIIQDSFLPILAPQSEISNEHLTKEIINVMQEPSATVLDTETVCQISSTPNTTTSIDTESVNTADVNSFLNRSNILDVTSPISPTEQTFQEVENDQIMPTEAIIKTDLIAPQYPEETVITPSEETKTDTPLIVDDLQAPAALPEVVPEAEIKEKIDDTIIAGAAGAAAVAIVAVATSTAAIKDKKASSKPLAKVQPTAKKTAKSGVATSKATTTKSTVSKSSTLTKSSASSPTKPMPSATKTLKPPTTAKSTTPRTTPAKLSPKPKTETAIIKSSDKKPLMNGDVKAIPKTSLVKKLPSTTTTRSNVTAKPSLTLSKLSPTKTDSKLGVTKASSLTARPTSSTTASTKSTSTLKTTASTISTSPKPRPTSLISKTTGSSSTTKTTSTVSTTKMPVQSKSSTTASSPRTMTAKPKPPTSVSARPPASHAITKQKLSTTKSQTKGPDTEKQLKDSVNKQLTTSRTSASTKTSGSLSAGRTTTTTVRKTEVKSPATRTTSGTKTTITTIKSTTKKPAEITRITKKIAPTKTTIKSQENGLTNGVTTIVQETTTILSTEPQLIKDLSPVENKLIVDNSQLSETNVAD